MRARYQVVVHARRGNQPSYTYVVEDAVKPGKLSRVVYDTAKGILEHECRNTFTGYLTAYPFGAIVVVGGREGCRFVVRANRR